MPKSHTYILLADDDSEDQELIKEALLQEDPSIAVETVWNGQQVMSYLEEHAENELPSLVILDYKMPILDAGEVLVRMKQSPRYEQMAKIVWSTSSNAEHVKKCLENGASRYLMKPNSPADLTDIAQTILSLYRASA